jgi:TolA-binding protein
MQAGSRWSRSVAACGVVAIALAATCGRVVPVSAAEPAAAADPRAAEFEARLRGLAQDPAGASDAQVLALLEDARVLGRSYAANLAMKAYFAKHPSPPAPVLLAAADNSLRAGDLRGGVGRLKAAIAALPAGEERSRAAARLYETLLDGLGNIDDAYSFMSRHAPEMRQSVEARRFDQWYLEQAQSRRDAVGMARILASMMEDKLPLELERILCWDRIEWLMSELARAKPEYFEALQPARKIVGLLRESPPRAARYAFILAWLEYQAGAAGKDKAGLDKAFEPVMVAATAYVDAVPTSATLAYVQETFFRLRNNLDIWSSHADQITGWWTAAFPKLPDGEKAQAINWAGRWPQQAKPEQWVELGVQFPEVFRTAVGTRQLPVLVNAPDPAVYAKQATFLAGVPSNAAKVVNAVVATKGTDLQAGLDHLVRTESWHGGFETTFTCGQQVWQAWNGFPRNPPAPGDAWNKALLAWAPGAMLRTPVALLHPPAAQAYLQAAWESSGADADDKSAFTPHLRSLDWLPWDEKTRKETIGPVHAAYRAWADGVRKRSAGAEKAKLEKAAALIAPLEEEFKKAFDPAVSAGADFSKVADPLTVHLARCVQAIREKKVGDFAAAGRQAYALVRDTHQAKTPFGLATLHWLVANRLDAFDTIDFQCEVIADQVAMWTAAAPGEAADLIRTATARPHWAPWGVNKAETAKALQYSLAIGKGMVALADKGLFNIQFLDQFRAYRRGAGWREWPTGSDVIAKIVEKKLLPGTGCQWLIREECPDLAKTYPLDQAFDDRIVEEAKASGWLDWKYFEYGGRDVQRKLANAAADIFAGFKSLATGPGHPLGFDRLPPWLRCGDSLIPSGERKGWGGEAYDYSTWQTYSLGRDPFWNWQWHALSADKPKRDALVTAVESAWGTTRFDSLAQGLASVPVPNLNDPKDQAAARSPEWRARFFATLAAYLEKGKSSPQRLAMPSFASLTFVDGGTLAAQELATLMSMYETSGGTPSTWRWVPATDQLGRVVMQGLVAAGRAPEIARHAVQFWRMNRETENPGPRLAQFGGSVAGLGRGGKTDVAASVAECGIEMLGTEMPEDVRSILVQLRSEAILAFGGVNPVPRVDPRWPIYEAQLAFAAGKSDAAWERYLPAAAVVNQHYKDLDPAFVTWLIRENTKTGGFDRARELGQLMLAWSEANPAALDLENQAALLLAYADIALARREYPQARGLYERIAAAKEFDGTVGKRDAEIRVAEVDRLTRQFDRARDLLQKLSRRPDKTLQAEALYQMALLEADQDNFKEAAGCLEQVFARAPNHVDGRILEGRLNLQLRKYAEATEVSTGAQTDKTHLVPGKPLKVDLEDRNLAVVGKSTQIAIRAWTDGGDEETFNLLPFGDSKTRFSGQIPTQLGAPVKGDHVLQVRGGDVVRYAFATAPGAAPEAAREPATMTVITDADLFASSGDILSREQMEDRRLEKLIRQRLRLDDEMHGGKSLGLERSDDQIKPGNPINVRVVDPDRSTTLEPDEVQVRAATASGDSLTVALRETGGSTGVFEGTVPTGGSQPTAYASDSADGSDPNSAIDPQPGSPWVGASDSVRPKWFAVDLNDNVELGSMSVTANVQGRRLRDVFVQTSMNGRDFRTVGQWRGDGKADFKPWDGRPTLELVRFLNGLRQPQSAGEFEQYLAGGRFAKGSPLVTTAVAPAVTLDGNFNGAGPALRMEAGYDWVVGRWRAAFFVPKNQVRTFTVDPKGRLHNVRYLFAIDGRIAENRGTPLTISRALDKGVHRIDLYFVCHRYNQAAFELLVDSPEPPFTAPVPAVFFDPAQPEVAAALACPVPEIKAAEEGGRLDIAFGQGTRARVVRLLLADFETDAPAINAVTLADAAGRKLLPTAKPHADLASNRVLEIVPGDRITVAYDDPSVITRGKARQDRFLTATFSNADISATFVEYRQDEAGRRTAVYVPMRRFKAGDAVKVFIRDPDMDMTDAADKVPFTAHVEGGSPVQLEALETEEHSGVFLGSVFPVAGEPTRAGELTVRDGQDVMLTYLDRENTDPGVPWERKSLVEQIGADDPQLRIYDVAGVPLEDKDRKAAEQRQAGGRRVEEVIPVTRDIVAVRPSNPAAADAPARVLADGPLIVELLAPRTAQSARSKAQIYVQTLSGREQLGRPVAEGEFPLDVPGTVRLERYPGDPQQFPAPPGVRNVVVRESRFAADPLAEGRYTFLVAKELGKVPGKSLVDEPYDIDRNYPPPPVLKVRGNDTVFVGFRKTDEAGKESWVVQSAVLTSDPIFDVMDRRFQETLAGTHVGDTLHLRLMNASLDTSDEKDTATVTLTASGGGAIELPLTETFGHSGVFKAAARLDYRAADAAAAAAAGDAGRTLPVGYGETVTARYAAPGAPPLERTVTIFRGGDAELVPFTKRFREADIAVQTQFTVAEAWFELAKRHRELGQESLARREINQGRKLLEEAIRDYPNTEAQVQADYLLANLAFEFSKDAVNEEESRRHAMEAVTRFSDLVASHPDSQYAPKSQFKKALVLEKLGQIDQACEEYVKLSYRYPENELVAETIARLGQYFLSKGKEFDAQAKAKTDPVEKEKEAIKGREMFGTAAQVFARLGERFPQHSLASKTRMLSGQCSMRARDYEKAVETFEAVYKDEKTDKDLAAEAMYWAGDVNLERKDFKAAYRAFKKLTWDYPESKWAKFARGRLTESAMVSIQTSEDTTSQ